jgi:hypothetical protein
MDYTASTEWIEALYRQGLFLKARGGKIVLYSLERAALTDDQRVYIRNNRDVILSYVTNQKYPLSPQQSGMWFIDHYLLGKTNQYNISIALRLTGLVDVPLLNKTFKILTERQEGLRTTFIHEAHDEIWQTVYSKEEFRIDLAPEEVNPP